MRGRLWLHYFVGRVGPKWKEEKADEYSLTAQWTDFMKRVMDEVGRSMNCYVARLRPDDSERSGEYLNIDAVFIDNTEYGILPEHSRYDPFALPIAVVELENDYSFQKASYDLWKILCVRAAVRILICCQPNFSKVQALKEDLERTVWQGSLMRGTDSDLILIVGNEGAWPSSTSFGEYYTVFEWRNDRFEEVRDLKWE